MPDQEFGRIGKRLYSEGLVGGNFGNMSIRSKDGFCITRTGCYLDEPGEPVFVPLDGDAPREASSEYRVHREIYRKTRHNAVVHAHPPHAVAISLLLDEVIPQDSKGEMLCPLIPVVQGKPGSDELARTVSDALCLSNLTLASGHGTFAAGKDLREAYLFTSLGEHGCKVISILQSLRSGVSP
jgi:L-fuculose-phosphate aldolase